MTSSPPERTAAPNLPAGPPLAGTAAVQPGPAPALPPREASEAGPGPDFGPPRTWTLEMPAGLMTLSLNGRLHWSEKNRRAAELRKAAWAIALQQKVPHLERVSLVVEYQPPDRRHRDGENIPIASGKHMIDGIVAAGVLDDDECPRYVTGVLGTIGPVCPRGRLVLHITEVPS